MIGELIAAIDMVGANRWCVNRCKDRTIFEEDGKEYIIFWVKEFRVKLYDIDTFEESGWIEVPDFQKWYRDTGYRLVLEDEED